MSEDRFPPPSDASPAEFDLPDSTDPDAGGMAPPAPYIDLGGDPVGLPEKPLGPRRLALLQEQLAQHQRDLERADSGDPEHVDPQLAAQQRRMAELASRAAIASQEDRELAEEAIAQTQSFAPIRDVEPEPVTEPEPVSVVEADAETETEAAAAADPAVGDTFADPLPESAADDEADLPFTSEEPEEPADLPAATDDGDLTTPSDPAEEGPHGSTVVGAPDTGPEPDSEPEPAPSAPVRAVDSQGLQLMEPKEYRSSGAVRTTLLSLAAVIVLALVALVLILLLT